MLFGPSEVLNQSLLQPEYRSPMLDPGTRSLTTANPGPQRRGGGNVQACIRHNFMIKQ